MGWPQFFTYFLLTALLASSKHVITQNNSSSGFNGAERDALLALKDEFNNTFLNSNWHSIMCYMNHTPQWYGIQCSNGRVTGIVLENMELSGKIKPDALVNLTELSVLSFKNNSILGNIMNFSQNQKLTQIDLSGNKFEGPILDSLLTLNFLESLQLQDNMLIGSIPPFNQSSLREFNVSNNRLSGQIPNTTALQSFNASSFSDNPNLCGPPTYTSCNVSTSDASKSHSAMESHFGAIFIVIDYVGLVVIVFLFIIYYAKSRKIKEYMKKRIIAEEEVEKGEKSIEMTEKSVAEEEEKGKLAFINTEVRFELSHLWRASAECLGKGKFGSCYKARLDDGLVVVVKWLRDLKPLSCDEFAEQMKAMADQKHPNLLPLLAYYYSKDEKLLVCKFASNGNIYNRIHGGRGTKDRIPFRWSARLSVARGVARALQYLHLNTKSQSIIPHGNLKSSNILLDENGTALVSDYGLTSLIAVPSVAQGMVAYESPEYRTYMKVSKKSDVWSYGCFLLELLTGRVSAHAAPQGVDLASWVHHAVREEWTAEILDLEISVQRSANHAMLRLLEIAVWCCDQSSGKRPDMSAVVREVENVKMVVDSEDEDDLSSDQSLTVDLISATPSMVMNGDDR